MSGYAYCGSNIEVTLSRPRGKPAGHSERLLNFSGVLLLVEQQREKDEAERKKEEEEIRRRKKRENGLEKGLEEGTSRTRDARKCR